MLVIGFRLLPHVHFALLNNFICDSDSGREFLPLCRCKVCYSVTVSLNFDSSFCCSSLCCCEVSSKGDAVLVLLYAQEDQKQISDIVIILIRFFCGKAIRGARRGAGREQVYQQVAELRSTPLEYFKLDELLTA